MGNPMLVFDDAEDDRKGKKAKTSANSGGSITGDRDRERERDSNMMPALLRPPNISPAMRRLLSRAAVAPNSARAPSTAVTFGTFSRQEDEASLSSSTTSMFASSTVGPFVSSSAPLTAAPETPWDSDIDAIFLNSFAMGDSASAGSGSEADLERRRLRVLRRAQPSSQDPPTRRRELVARALERMVFDRIARAEQQAGQANDAASISIRNAEREIMDDIAGSVARSEGTGPRSFGSGDLLPFRSSSGLSPTVSSPEDEATTPTQYSTSSFRPETELTSSLTARLREQATQLDHSLGQIARLFDALSRVRRELDGEDQAALNGTRRRIEDFFARARGTTPGLSVEREERERSPDSGESGGSGSTESGAGSVDQDEPSR